MARTLAELLDDIQDLAADGMYPSAMELLAEALRHRDVRESQGSLALMLRMVSVILYLDMMTRVSPNATLKALVRELGFERLPTLNIKRPGATENTPPIAQDAPTPIPDKMQAPPGAKVLRRRGDR